MPRSIKHIDEPWSFEEIRDSCFANSAETGRLIKGTKGGMLWTKLSALHDCLKILNSCTNDLLDTINEFSHATAKPGFWNMNNRIEQERYTNEVRRHMFCTACAAMALVDHSRGFSKVFPIKDLEQKRNEYFGNAGWHSFIQGLRNYVVHIKIAEANWRISWREDVDRTRDVKFIFCADDLFEYGNWKPEAKQFIDQSEDGIDIYRLFSGYLECASNYYGWHRARVIDNYSADLETYFVYARHLNRVMEKTKWNLIISYLKEGVDIFQHLDEYLTHQQIEDILGYKYGSRQQVDRLIETLDVYKVCDHELRESIYSKLVRNTTQGGEA